MSDFKFACPICGQHMSCDRDKAGTHIECPSCFREIIVPQPPADENSKFVLTASEARARAIPGLPATEPALAKGSPFHSYVLWVGVFVVVAGIAIAGYTLRYKAAGQKAQADKTGAIPPTRQTQPTVSKQPDGPWTLDLENVAIPELPVSGRIAGRSFTCARATLHGGTLNLRQGPVWPPDVGLTIYLDADRGEDMAGRRYIFSPTNTLPRLAMRWKDSQGKPVKHNVKVPYALRLEFGPLLSNRVPGKIYCCIADPERSYVVGMFEAEIRTPAPERSSRK